MNKSKEEIKKLIDLIQLEHQEDQRIYNENILTASIQERQARGVCWQPLLLKDRGYGLGDYPFIIVERTKKKGTEHQFSAGKSVSVFLVNGDAEYEHIQGTINYVDRDLMKIIFLIDDLPDWIDKGSIGVNLLFDEKTYTEMVNALNTVLEAKNNRLSELTQLILGHIDAQAPTKIQYIDLPQLNASQNKAAQLILTTSDVGAIHGPPGTGKTTTLVHAIKLLTKQEKGILVCAPSNAATDLLTERLAQVGVNVTRIGNLSRIDDSIIEHTLESKLSIHTRAKEIKQLKRQVIEYRRMAGKYKRNFGREEREQRRLLYREAKKMAAESIELEDHLIEDIITKSEVITCTLVGANNRYIKDYTFNTCVIDEAAQALEPASWIPICKSNKVIFAGDPFQLPPTIKSSEAKKLGLEITLLEKVIQRHDHVTLLDTQYRMHNTIMGFSNRQFYCNELKAHSSVATASLEISNHKALEFIDTAGCGFSEQKNPETLSLFNPEEYTILKKHLDSILLESSMYSIGIISPYREQVKFITESLGEETVLTHQITVNTIDSFQGQERDIIYISMVRSNENNEIGFLKDFRRMNVAMTRAKKKLIIVGDSATLGNEKFYTDFLSYCEEHDAYHSAWEWISYE